MVSLIHTGHVIVKRRSNIALVLSDLQAVLSVQKGLAALVHLDLGDLAVGSVDANVDGLTIGLVSSAALHVDDVLSSMNSNHLALLALEVTADNSHLIILADRNGANLTNRDILAHIQ